MTFYANSLEMLSHMTNGPPKPSITVPPLHISKVLIIQDATVGIVVGIKQK